MEIIKTKIHIDIEKPFTFLHMSDTHLTLVDGRDDERKIEVGKNRSKLYSQAEKMLEETAAYAKVNDYMVCHTGDLIDFVSHANIDRAKQFADEVDVLMVAGSHEFSLYADEVWEDEAYRNQSLDAVQAAFHNNIRFSCREVNGVNLVSLDNGYYLIEESQLDALKAVAKQGKPIILFMHTPLYTHGLYEYSKEAGGKCAYLMAVPEDKMDWYSEFKFRQQRADAITREAYDYILGEPLIKAVIAGHKHINYEDMIKPGVPQILTSAADIREITVQ